MFYKKTVYLLILRWLGCFLVLIFAVFKFYFFQSGSCNPLTFITNSHSMGESDKLLNHESRNPLKCVTKTNKFTPIKGKKLQIQYLLSLQLFLSSFTAQLWRDLSWFLLWVKETKNCAALISLFDTCIVYRITGHKIYFLLLRGTF